MYRIQKCNTNNPSDKYVQPDNYVIERPPVKHSAGKSAIHLQMDPISADTFGKLVEQNKNLLNVFG